MIKFKRISMMKMKIPSNSYDRVSADLGWGKQGRISIWLRAAASNSKDDGGCPAMLGKDGHGWPRLRAPWISGLRASVAFLFMRVAFWGGATLDERSLGFTSLSPWWNLLCILHWYCIVFISIFLEFITFWVALAHVYIGARHIFLRNHGTVLEFSRIESRASKWALELGMSPSPSR